LLHLRPGERNQLTDPDQPKVRMLQSNDR